MKENQGAARWIRAVAVGAAAGALLCAVLMLLLAGLLAAKDVPQGAIQPLAVSAAALGSLLGGLVAAWLAGERAWLLGLACGGVLFLAVLLTGGFALIRGGGLDWLVRLAALPGAGLLGGVLRGRMQSGRRGGGHHHRRR